jgi:hypothetical protein
MTEGTSANLAASLHSTASDLSKVANGLAGLSSDDEIERHATILDHIAEDAREGASILRTLIVRRERAHSPLPRWVPRDSASVHPILPGIGENAS